jgi:hypothetical protein
MRKLILVLFVAATLVAQSKFDFWPGAQYDPAVPTFKKILGHDPGERILWHAGLVKYMEALQAAAPKRVKVFDYGKTFEGRRLIYVGVGSEANIRRLDEIRTGMKKLADPRKTPEAEAKKLMASLPAVIWLGYGVHGNEISSPDASLLTAYHLLASRNDKMVDDILANVLVLLVPSQNPDGRDRFVHGFEQAEGIEPDPNPASAEHSEPWPGGRSNHYLFDMNRDWIAFTQPEIRGQAKALLEWYPLVYADLHEMGADSTYYFAPEAVPYNPHLAKDQRDALTWFGKNNAKWFDKFGFRYFTREVFDAFYPGYGASWPAYYGAVAMTYEQASARGLLVRRSDDQTFHFRDTVRQHFIASVSTCETAAGNRDKLLANFWHYRQTAIEEGQKEPVKEYVLVRKGDTSAVDKLALLMAEMGIEVRRATASFKAGGKEYPAGSYAVSLAQPSKRMIRTLFDTNVPMEDFFVKEQERRRAKKLPDEIYDVTAWSLPLQFGVETAGLAEPAQASFTPVKPGEALPGKVTGKASLAYLVPWGTQAAARFLTTGLRADLLIYSSDKPFTQTGRTYPAGTLIVKVQENPPTLAATLDRLARETGAEVVATDTGWMEDGVNFGSRYVTTMKKAVIALAWDQPVSSQTAGFTRFVLERQYNYPVSVVRARTLGSTDLSKFHVIILPDSGLGEGYSTALGPNGARRLKDWAAAGGTLIGIGGGAVSFLADPRNALLSVQQENLAKPPEAAKEAAAAGAAPRRPETPSPGAGAAPAVPPADTRVAGKILTKEEDYLKAIRADSELPDSVAGVLVKAKTDPDHWITAGVPEFVHAVVSGRAVFTPIKLDKGVNAAYFVGPGELLAGGYLWEENRKQLAYKPLMVIERQGRGFVVGFTADPNYRAYMDGLNLLFLNAVFRGPAHARAGGRE